MDPDPAEAARLYRQGCDGGDAQGCTDLGYLHEEGIGMDPDPAEAARLYRQGCDGGDAGGCTNLGYLNEQGIGMDPDPAEAARLYRQGCDGGDAAGCTNLGILHQQGIGMDPDPRRGGAALPPGLRDGSGVCVFMGGRTGIEPALPARVQKNACRPVCARPRIRAWTSWVPS